MDTSQAIVDAMGIDEYDLYSNLTSGIIVLGMALFMFQDIADIVVDLGIIFQMSVLLIAYAVGTLLVEFAEIFNNWWIRVITKLRVKYIFGNPCTASQCLNTYIEDADENATVTQVFDSEEEGGSNSHMSKVREIEHSMADSDDRPHEKHQSLALLFQSVWLVLFAISLSFLWLFTMNYVSPVLPDWLTNLALFQTHGYGNATALINFGVFMGGVFCRT